MWGCTLHFVPRALRVAPLRVALLRLSRAECCVVPCVFPRATKVFHPPVRPRSPLCFRAAAQSSVLPYPAIGHANTFHILLLARVMIISVIQAPYLHRLSAFPRKASCNGAQEDRELGSARHQPGSHVVSCYALLSLPLSPYLSRGLRPGQLPPWRDADVLHRRRPIHTERYGHHVLRCSCGHVQLQDERGLLHSTHAVVLVKVARASQARSRRIRCYIACLPRRVASARLGVKPR
eukprot:2531688-Heterocapsa_arctica.AAC.1